MFLSIGAIFKDIIIVMALSIIPINSASFYKLFYQTTGQFKRFANSSYTYTIIYLLLKLILVFLFKSDNYIFYIMTTLVANLFIFIKLDFKFYKEYKNIKSKYSKEIINNIKVGFSILLANLSVFLFYGIDKWFVKIFHSNNDFAYYSFAIFMLNIVNIFINAVSIIFYNYLAKGEDKEKVKELKIYFLIIGE